MSWNDLSMSERAAIIQLGVKAGVTSLSNIKDAYNSYAKGGRKFRLIGEHSGTNYGEFNSEEEAREYMASNNMEQTFRESLPELIVKARVPDKVTFDTDNTTMPERIVPPTFKGGLPYDGWTDAEKDRYLRKIEHSGLNRNAMAQATRDIYADRNASQYDAPEILGALASGMNAFSPSQQYGAIRDWYNGDAGYWEGIGKGNSGFFDRKWAAEHPMKAFIGNMGIDAAFSLAGLDFIDAYSNSRYLNSASRYTMADLRRRGHIYEVGQPLTYNPSNRVTKAIKLARSLEKDVPKKLRTIISEEGRFISPIEKSIIDRNIFDQVNISASKLENPILGISKTKDRDIGISLDFLNDLNKSDDDFIARLATILNHEGHHSKRGLLKDLIEKEKLSYTLFERNKVYRNLGQQIKDDVKNYLNRAEDSNTYTPKEQELLDKAFTFTDDYLRERNPLTLLEKGASARELAAEISRRNGNVMGEELDKIIDEMSDLELFDILSKQNGYTRNFYKQLVQTPDLTKEFLMEKAQAIREAIKYIR